MHTGYAYFLDLANRHLSCSSVNGQGLDTRCINKKKKKKKKKKKAALPKKGDSKVRGWSSTHGQHSMIHRHAHTHKKQPPSNDTNLKDLAGPLLDLLASFPSRHRSIPIPRRVAIDILVLALTSPFLILFERNDDIQCPFKQGFHAAHLLAAAFHVQCAYPTGDSFSLLCRNGRQALTLE